jgi:hypothetical protein
MRSTHHWPAGAAPVGTGIGPCPQTWYFETPRKAWTGLEAALGISVTHIDPSTRPSRLIKRQRLQFLLRPGQPASICDVAHAYTSAPEHARPGGEYISHIKRIMSQHPVPEDPKRKHIQQADLIEHVCMHGARKSRKFAK